ncbi:unnamed protein product [[Candida] boidinii]|nr:unnamed protein product [[Candida] boidinii]
MHQIIKSNQPLTDSHYQSFIYQILCGLKYIHSADVLHRDLKPGNLLVNADCELKICDFGLARGYSSDPEKNNGFLTEYVATRWYRAPEIILSFQGYTKAIDVWSVGCILAELLGGETIFKGKDYVDQLNEILKVLGTPDEDTLQSIKSVRAQQYVRSLPHIEKTPFKQMYPNANDLALDLLDKILIIDPRHRITVEEALEHPYLEVWHDPNDEPVCSSKFDFSFEAVDEMEPMRQMIIDEVSSFREFVRKPVEIQNELQQQQEQQQQQQQQQEEEAQAQAQVQAIAQAQAMAQLQAQAEAQALAEAQAQAQAHAQAQAQAIAQMQAQAQAQAQAEAQAHFMMQQQVQATQYQQQMQQHLQQQIQTPTNQFLDESDMPPRPQENSFLEQGVDLDLEQELEYGLDTTYRE